MADFYPQLVALLVATGCRKIRPGRGSHEISRSPLTERNFTLPKSTKSRHTANEVLKQTGLPKAF
jgi:hypothetical protein